MTGMDGERERSKTDRWMDRGREGQTDRKKGGMSQQRERWRYGQMRGN